MICKFLRRIIGGARPLPAAGATFARTGATTGLTGKFDDELAIRMDATMKARIQMAATSERMTAAEWARTVFACALDGTEHAASVEAERIRRVGRFAGQMPDERRA